MDFKIGGQTPVYLKNIYIYFNNVVGVNAELTLNTHTLVYLSNMIQIDNLLR